MLTDPKKTKDEIVQWIRDYFAENGPECSAVVGISGGKDSTIVAALCVEALGKDRVFGVMMPNGIQADIKDSIQVVKLSRYRHFRRQAHRYQRRVGYIPAGEVRPVRHYH